MSLIQRKTLNEFSTNANEEFFNTIYSAGSKVPHSGIYKCTECKREVAVNDHEKDNKFPPHYQDSKFSCTSPKWKPYVIADSKASY